MARRMHKGRQPSSFTCIVCKKKLPKRLIWWRRNKQNKRPVPICEKCLSANYTKKWRVYDNEVASHTILDKSLADIVAHPKVRDLVFEKAKKRKTQCYIDVCQLVRSEKPGRNGLYVWYWKPIVKLFKPTTIEKVLYFTYHAKKFERGRNIFKIRYLREVEPGVWRLLPVRLSFSDERGWFSLDPNVFYGQTKPPKPQWQSKFF